MPHAIEPAGTPEKALWGRDLSYLAGAYDLAKETAMATRSIVVIGTSAGGVEALTKLADQLPAGFPAAVLAVIHLAPFEPSHLDEIVGRSSRLKTCLGRQGQRIKTGSIYLAPPDQHMVVEDHQIRLTRGPHENRVRPAVDPLFRSVAVTYGPQAIGVVMTGALDDGTAGLLAIKRCGGIAVVQDPEDAAYPDMPRNAMAAVTVDYSVPLHGMAEILATLAREPINGDFQPPADLVREVKMSNRELPDLTPDASELESWGRQVPMSCPECGGPLREHKDVTLRRYRCHVGHSFTAQNLLADQSEKVETALWTAVRTLEERARMLSTIAEDQARHGHKRVAKPYKERADEARQQAHSIRSLLAAH